MPIDPSNSSGIENTVPALGYGPTDMAPSAPAAEPSALAKMWSGFKAWFTTGPTFDGGTDTLPSGDTNSNYVRSQGADPTPPTPLLDTAVNSDWFAKVKDWLDSLGTAVKWILIVLIGLLAVRIFEDISDLMPKRRRA